MCLIIKLLDFLLETKTSSKIQINISQGSSQKMYHIKPIEKPVLWGVFHRQLLPKQSSISVKIQAPTSTFNPVPKLD